MALTKSSFGTHASLATRLQPQTSRYNVASTPSSQDHPEQSNKRRMPMQTSEVFMSDSPLPYAHSPCRQHACAHAPSGRMQSSGTGLPLLPRWARDSRCGTEIPSMHVIAASSPGPRSRGDRRRAHIIKTCPFRHPPPTPPHSPARHSPRQPYEPPVGGIHLEVSYLPASACISLHLPASPIADIGASRGAHHGANPRATRRSSRRRMASCPPSDTVLPRRSLRAHEEAGAASR